MSRGPAYGASSGRRYLASFSIRFQLAVTLFRPLTGGDPGRSVPESQQLAPPIPQLHLVTALGAAAFVGKDTGGSKGISSRPLRWFGRFWAPGVAPSQNDAANSKLKVNGEVGALHRLTSANAN